MFLRSFNFDTTHSLLCGFGRGEGLWSESRAAELQGLVPVKCVRENWRETGAAGGGWSATEDDARVAQVAAGGSVDPLKEAQGRDESTHICPITKARETGARHS